VRRAGGAEGEREGNTSISFEDFRTEIGSSQGQNLALTGVCAPSSLDCGGAGEAHLTQGDYQSVLENQIFHKTVNLIF